MTAAPTVNSPIVIPRLLTAYPGTRSPMQEFPYGIGTTYPELLAALTNFVTEDMLTYVQGLNQDNKALIDILNAAIQAQTDSVMSQLQVILAQIIAGENVELNDGSILAAIMSPNSVTRKNAFGYYTLYGEGIDPTGATVSTEGVQAFLDGLPSGASVCVPNGAVFTFDDTIALNNKIHLWGDGELRWISGIANKEAIKVLVDYSNLDGLYITNPNRLAGRDGNRTSGITIYANHIRVADCHIDGQQAAIFVEANGEWHDHIIMRNLVENVPGSGGGATNAGDPHGEDRGDGIYSMGATGIIVGNRVSALPGTDARIGIGVENLAVYEATAYEHGDAMFTISNNVVTGQFRRSIASEGVADCAITANTVADFTFWGINIVNTSHRNVVADNTITATKNAGTDVANWATRAGIYVYDNVGAVVIHDNEIYVNPDARLDVGIGGQVGSGGPATDAYIHHNIIDGNGRMALGVQFGNGIERPRINDNTIRGFTDTGISVIGHDIEACRNVIAGTSTVDANGHMQSGKGIDTNGGNTHGRFIGNRVTGVALAMRLFFHGIILRIIDNEVEAAAEGINVYGFAANSSIQIDGNMNRVVGTPYLSMPTGYTPSNQFA